MKGEYKNFFGKKPETRFWKQVAVSIGNKELQTFRMKNILGVFFYFQSMKKGG